MRKITYNASKTASQFHLDNSFVRLQVGAIRCGKSVSNCLEIFRRAAQQQAAKDGIRYSRWAICRNTYPDLKSTTIRTWLDWFPEDVYGKIKYDSPIVHHIRIADIDLEVLFISLDRDDDVKKLMSLELTGIYFNELQFITELLFDKAIERVNNYPPKKMGVPITFGGVIADTNPPNVRHWIYTRFEKSPPSTHRIFKYVPAVIKVDNTMNAENVAYSRSGTAYMQNPKADFITNLQDSNYYLNAVKSSWDENIRVYYQGEYGTVTDNKRVFSEYNDQFHCVPHISYSPQLELGLGWDFGRTPAVILTQLSNDGVFSTIDEICAEDIVLEEFVLSVVIPYLNRNYPGWRNNISIGDPAGISKNALSNDHCFDVLARCGIPTQPALSQSLERRINAVSYFLRKMIKGRPAFMMSAKCEVLREGFNGQYYYHKLSLSHDHSRYREEPEKNMHSHPHDALQYIALHYFQYFEYGQSANEKNHLSPRIIY